MAQTDATSQAVGQFVLPASYAQQRMWFLDRIEAGGAVYNVPLATRIRGPLAIDALERALQVIVDRHETLRTTFTLLEGVPHQVVRPSEPVALKVIDVGDEADPPTRGVEIATGLARESFDLERDLLLRAALIRLGPDEHILSLTLHHIITDAWSMGVLGRELGDLYGAFLAGEELELGELPIQYGDYASWQQQWFESGGLAPQLDYWRAKLAGAPALLELPTDKPRPAEQSFRGDTIGTVLASELLERAKALGEREGTTLFMILLAAFASLLSRYSGQGDLVIGTPVANRSRVELEPLIGLLVNTLPLRVQLDDDPSFSQLLGRVRETSLEAFSNQDLPFEKLVQELAPPRSRSHAPVTQVLFVLQSKGQKPLRLAGLEHERVLTDRGTAKFDLALFAAEDGAGLLVEIEYCTELFERQTIERMLEHYGVLLEAALASPDRPVSRLPMLSEQERGLLLEGFGDDRGPDRCVHELFAEQVLRTPDATAVIAGSQRLSYRELDRRANALAQHLRELGVGPESIVAIAAERSVEMVLGVLAVLKAGGAYAPIDPEYPAERVAFMLEDSGAAVLLTQSRLVDRLPAHGIPTVCLDAVSGEAERAEAGATLDNLAYVIYTSGSTGRPKAVAMPHRPLANLIAWQLADLPHPVAARTLQFASLSFDVAFQELLTTWCSGGTLVLIDEHTRRDTHALLSVIEAEQVERLFLPFVALQALCEAAEHARTTLPALREVITAGEQLKITAPVRRFFARHPNTALYNQYGPSETHVVTSYRCEGPAAGWPSLPPIGRPVAGATIYLLDRHGEPVPIGVPGELYAGGIPPARGYLKRPELTAERFMSDPFNGGRMYRTGDLARHLPGGEIAFLGRADDQVKVRGFRVELGEVEAALARHEAVAEAVVALREERLVAYLLPREPAKPPQQSDLLAHLRRVLPDFMIPQRFVVLEKLPLTPSGKVDRRALPAPDNPIRTPGEHAQPETELEHELASIWRRLLGVDAVGVDEDFFDLGGHSLLAVQLVHAIESELGRTCTLPVLFRNRTVRALAAELHTGGVDATEPSILELARGDGPALFCICGVHAYQELAEELAPDYSVYGIFLPLEQQLFENGGPRTLTVEEMAARYVEAVRGQQPDGPYLLLGFCFGGVLAYEAAQQLRRAGEEVSLLLMLDSRLGSLMPERSRPSLKRRVREHALRHYELLPAALQRRLIGPDWPSETKRLELLRVRIYSEAMRRYRVAEYPGSAVLVRPALSATAVSHEVSDDSWGWGARVEQIDVCNVPGGHLTHLRRPNVHLLAREIRPHLDRAARSMR